MDMTMAVLSIIAVSVKTIFSNRWDAIAGFAHAVARDMRINGLLA